VSFGATVGPVTSAQRIFIRPHGAAVVDTKFSPLFDFILTNNRYQIVSGLFIY
jgi:hypothetical protein